MNFNDFIPQTEFTKSAIIEKLDFEDIPENMETRILDGDFTQFLSIKECQRIFRKYLNKLLVAIKMKHLQWDYRHES